MKTTTEMVLVDIDKLIPYVNNARTHSKEQIIKLRSSLREFGFINPVIIDKEYNIIAGHGRVIAAKEENIKEIPCVFVDYLTDAQKKAYILADNRMALDAGWDESILKNELEALEKNGFDLGLTGFDSNELNDLFNIEKEVEEDNFNVELKEEVDIKQGDMFQLGNHILLCGDSTKEEDVDRVVGNNTINCVFTSPPYNMGADMYENYDDNLKSEEYIEFNLKVIKNIKKHLKGFLFWNISYNKNSRNEFLKIANRICDELVFKEMIIWNKKKAMPIRSKEIMTRTYEDIFLYESQDENNIEVINLYENRKGLLYNKSRNKIIKNYWEINVDNDTQLKNHKACYPVKLPAEGIQLTTKENDVVFEPFCGSGTNIIACEQLNRKCIAIEFDPRYCDVIIRRWETFTGKKAIKLN